MSAGVESAHAAEGLAGRRREVLAVAALDRGDPLAADEVVVAILQLDRAARLAGCRQDILLLDRCHFPLLFARVLCCS